jgi:SH3-like domain-containing protein
VRIVRSLTLALLAVVSAVAGAEDFKQTNEAATIGYEGPSTRAAKQYLYSRGTPLEILVQIEGWYKVRDSQGALVWVERKTLGDRGNVQVKPGTAADVFANPDANSPVAFRVDGGVLLNLVAPPSPSTGAFAQIRHRDGQTGYMRLDSLFGL